MKPHKHAELIKKWADGAEIEARYPDSGHDRSREWHTVQYPSWSLIGWEYRVKPPREFPKSSLSPDDISSVYAEAYGGIVAKYFNAKKKKALWEVANAAIKQYILDTEQGK